jgi:O-antigen biosynthesis protein
MTLLVKALRHLRIHGYRATLRRILAEFRPAPQTSTTLPAVSAASAQAHPMHNGQQLTGHPISPLQLNLLTIESRSSVHLITDKLGSDSLFGGVGTALILAVLAANQRNAQLQIITRTELAKPQDVFNFFQLFGLKPQHEISLVYAPVHAKKPINYVAQDLFITTSWWSTHAVSQSVRPEQMLYLLQEDERMFYAYGDEHMACSKTLADQRIPVLVNTELLHQHLKAEGIISPQRQAHWFEPAFPTSLYQPQPTHARLAGSKRRLCFYARPQHPRNLYHFGIKLLEQAIERSLLDPALWEIHLMGSHIPKEALVKHCTPVIHDSLPWADYARLIASMDLGLSLMYTPHPSYPPLDLAASGAVVVSNQFGCKTSLQAYSKNILCAPLEQETMLQALQEGMRLACDDAARHSHWQAQSLSRDWATTSFADVLRRLQAPGMS